LLFRHLNPLAVTAERLQNFGLVFLAFDGRIEDYPDLPAKLRTWGEGKTVAQIQNMLGVSPRADPEWASKPSPTASLGSASSSDRSRTASRAKKRVDQAVCEVLRPKTEVHPQPPSSAAPTRAPNRRKNEHENTGLSQATVRPNSACVEPSGKKASVSTEQANRRSEPETYSPADSADPDVAELQASCQLAILSMKQRRTRASDSEQSTRESGCEQDLDRRNGRTIRANTDKTGVEHPRLLLESQIQHRGAR
jgi:hypothetical protein